MMAIHYSPIVENLAILVFNQMCALNDIMLNWKLTKQYVSNNKTESWIMIFSINSFISACNMALTKSEARGMITTFVSQKLLLGS